MQFKPTYEATAAANKNPKIVFCAVETDKVRDCASANNIRSIPTFHFYLNGKNHVTFTGADPNKFKATLADLEKLVASKAYEHVNQDFK